VMPRATVGLVGGSDRVKILEQMQGEEAVAKYDYCFSENGLVAYKGSQLLGQSSILGKHGEANCQQLINFALSYMAGLSLPAKRGTFVEFRTGLINLCPVGRSCSFEERQEFARYDEEHGIRDAFKIELEKVSIEIEIELQNWHLFFIQKFGHLGLQFAKGGQISIDCFPTGWDKTFCLQYVAEGGYDEIHFFGDKTSPGGNDHEIFEDSRTIGHTVHGPEDTAQQLKHLLGIS